MNKQIGAIILFLVFACTACSPSAHTQPPPPIRKAEATSLPQVTPRPPDITDQAKKRESLKPAFLPTQLEIPAIRLTAQIEKVGVLANGEMGVPAAFDRAGLLLPGIRPGEKGNAAMAGHVDHKTGPAIFYHLRKLKPNDQVFVSDGEGKRLTFVVRSVEAFKTADAPLPRIFGPADTPRLNLITCTGKFNRKTGEHAMRLVVFTELAANQE